MVSLTYKSDGKRIECTLLDIMFGGKTTKFSIPDSDEALKVLEVIRWQLNSLKN